MDFFISNAYAQDAAASPNPIISMLPLLLMLPILYFLMIRPQQKRVKEHRELIAGLKKGDEVVTSGGIGGTITKVGDAFVTVRIADNVEMNVQKHAVTGLLPAGTLKAI
ncbi:MAG: preprotein translocase subunit YajC [Gammaproteobacteria bacterium]|nr:MAG: preprotein translocase subunit YajC [Gammaproteobacteria bacterium]PIE37275.1 MAG: preprotein translocase subunit YajC [Gammaproteobacteria bacterium]